MADIDHLKECLKSESNPKPVFAAAERGVSMGNIAKRGRQIVEVGGGTPPKVQSYMCAYLKGICASARRIFLTLLRNNYCEIGCLGEIVRLQMPTSRQGRERARITIYANPALTTQDEARRLHSDCRSRLAADTSDLSGTAKTSQNRCGDSSSLCSGIAVSYMILARSLTASSTSITVLGTAIEFFGRRHHL